MKCYVNLTFSQDIWKKFLKLFFCGDTSIENLSMHLRATFVARQNCKMLSTGNSLFTVILFDMHTYIYVCISWPETGFAKNRVFVYADLKANKFGITMRIRNLGVLKTENKCIIPFKLRGENRSKFHHFLNETSAKMSNCEKLLAEKIFYRRTFFFFFFSTANIGTIIAEATEKKTHDLNLVKILDKKTLFRLQRYNVKYFII